MCEECKKQIAALIAENERLTKAVGLQVIRRFVGDDDQKNIDELVAAGIQVDKELIVQLKAENERLRAEGAKWKNESVSDSQTIYSLSCNLAQRTGEVRELAGVVDDLSALTRRLVHHLTKAAPDSDLPAQTLDYLKRKGLQGSPMRELVEGRLS